MPYWHDPRVYSIALIQNLRVSDRHLNGDPSLDLNWEMHEWFLCDPRVPFITLTQDMGILDRCLDGRIFMGSFERIMINKKWDDNTLFNPRVYFVNSLWNPKVSRGWRFNFISFIINHGKKYHKHTNRVSKYTKGKRD